MQSRKKRAVSAENCSRFLLPSRGFGNVPNIIILRPNTHLLLWRLYS